LSVSLILVLFLIALPLTPSNLTNALSPAEAGQLTKLEIAEAVRYPALA
jgi:hypothetical protein